MKDFRIAGGRVRLVHRIGSAGENDSFGIVAQDICKRRVERKYFGVDIRFTNAASDQLGVLGTKIEDENGLETRRHALLYPHFVGLNWSVSGRAARNIARSSDNCAEESAGHRRK